MDKRKLVYDKLVSTGYKDSYEDFNKLFDASDANKRKVYDAFGKTGYKDSYEDFVGLMQTQKPTEVEQPKVEMQPQAAIPDVQAPEIAENPAPFTMDAKVKDYVLANKPDMFKSRSGNYATAPFTPGTEPLGELGERYRIAEAVRPEMIKEQNKGALRTLGDDVAALRKDLTAKINAQKEETSGLPVFRSDVGAALLRQTKEPKYASKEALQLQNVEYAEKLLNKSQRLLEEGENPSTSFIQGLGRGFSDSMSDLDKWTAGWADLENALRVKNIVRKIEQDQPLDASEQAVMDAMVTNAATEMLYRDSLDRGYGVGEVQGESLPFIFDMIVGMGTIQAATKPLSKAMMKYATTKLRDMGLKAGSLGMAAGRGVAHLGSGLKNVGLHTATFGAPRVAADYQERGLGQTEVGFDAAGNAMYEGQTGQESGLGAFGKSVISTAAETGSELLGEKFAPILGFVGQATGLNRLTKIMPKQLGAFAKEIKANPGYKEAMKFAKAAHISDPISETMEEEVNNLVSVAIGDMSPQELRDMDMHIDTFLGVAPVSVLFGGIGAGGYIRNKYKINKELKGFERMMQEEYGEDWTEIRNALQNSTIEEARGFVKDILMRGDLPKDRKAEMVQYVYANMQEQALSAMDAQMSPEEIEANKKEIWNAYQLAAKRIDFLSPLQKDELATMTIDEIDALNVDEKTKQRMIDYKAAAADMHAYEFEMDARIQRAREQAMAQVEELTNFSTGTVMRVKSGYSENPIHIVRGNLTFNEDGTVDSSKSDKVIYYLDDEGAVKMGSINMIQELVDNTDAATLAEQAANDAQAEVQAQEIEETSPIETGVQINVGNSQYEVGPKMPDGSYTVYVFDENGTRAEVMTEQQLQDLLTTQQAAQQEAVEVSAETTESAVTPQGEESSVSNNEANIMSNEQFEASLPKDKNGQLDFNAFTPQQAYEYTARTMGEDAAREDLQADLENKQSEVKKLSEQVKKASGGARLQARQKLAQAQEQLSSLQEFYNSVVPQTETQTEVQAEEVQPTEFEDKDTYDTLAEINSSLSPEEVDAFVANRQKAFEDEITKLEKKAPKIGTDMNAYLEQKKSFEAQKQELQRKADYWKDIRAELDAMRSQVGEEEATSVLEDMQPQNAEELAALFLTGLKLNRESYMKETGFGQEEARKMFGQFSKDGVSIERAGELLETMAREDGYNFFEEGAVNAGRTAILNVLSQVRTRGDLFKYLKDRREEQAKKLEEAARNAYETSIEQNFNMTVPEYEQYVEVAEREIKDRLMSEEDYAEFMSIFADETLNEEKNGREETDNRGSETSGEVLSGEQSDIEGGNNQAEKSAEPTDGRGDNEGDTAQERQEEQNKPGNVEEGRDTSIFTDTFTVPYTDVEANLTSYRSENGVGVAVYSVNGVPAVILSATNENNYVGYFAEIGEDGNPKNVWSSKMETEQKGVFKDMMKLIESELPANAQYTEVKSISTDGLRHFANQLKHGYVATGETREVAINNAARVNEFGFGEEGMNDLRVNTPKQQTKVLEVLKPYLEALGVEPNSVRFENGKAYIDLPVLQKTRASKQSIQPTQEVVQPTETQQPTQEAEVSAEQTDNIQPGESVLDYAKRVAEREEKKAPRKKLDMNEFASKEKEPMGIRGSLKGVYYKDGTATSSNGHIIVRTETSYPSEHEGKSVSSKGDVIADRYPDVDLVTPKKSLFSFSIDVNELKAERDALVQKLKEDLKKSGSKKSVASVQEATAIEVNIGSMKRAMMLDTFSMMVDALDMLGANKLEFIGDRLFYKNGKDLMIASLNLAEATNPIGSATLTNETVDEETLNKMARIDVPLTDLPGIPKSKDGMFQIYAVESSSGNVSYFVPRGPKVVTNMDAAYNMAGDRPVKSLEDAIKAAEEERAIYMREVENIVQDRERRAKEQAEKEQKAKEKAESTLGKFLATKTKLQAAKADKGLSDLIQYNGKVMSKANFIEQVIADGYAAEEYLDGTKTKYRLVKDGKGYTINKTEYDFAKFAGAETIEVENKDDLINLERLSKKYADKGVYTISEIDNKIAFTERRLKGINPNGKEGKEAAKMLEELKELKRLKEMQKNGELRFREDEQPIRRSIVDRDLNELSINLTGEDFSQYPYEDRRTNPDVEGDIWYGYSEPQYKGVNAMDSEEVPEPIKDILSDNEYEIDKADMVETLQNNIEFEGGYEEESAQPYVEALNWLAENGDNLVMSDKVNLIIDAPSDDVRFREDEETEGYNPRGSMPKVRGGWTKKKIIKWLKENPSRHGLYTAAKAIAEYESPQDLQDHMFYHGTVYGPATLKPSITMSDRDIERYGGGGYGQKYWAISLSKDKYTTTNFAGTSRGVNVYPVLLYKNAKVVVREDYTDSADLEDDIEQLWNDGVDAVVIGSLESGERELAVLNPKAICVIDRSTYYELFGLNRSKVKVLNEQEIEELYEFSKRFVEEIKNKPTKPLKPTRPSMFNDDMSKKTDEQYQKELSDYGNAMAEYEEALKEYENSEDAIRFENLEREARDRIRFRFIGEQGAARLDAAEEATTRLDNLNVAREMEQAGKDAKAIKMATGWERGADGKWRYETADAKKIDLSGNVRWLKRHPEYARRRELNKKANSAAILGTEPLTEAEQAEYDELKRTTANISLSKTQINPDRMKLADIVDDDALFEAYPELADIDVKIVTMNDGTIASVVTTQDMFKNKKSELRINKDVYESGKDRALLETTIEHEIQHLVQDAEGFARGGTSLDVARTRGIDTYALSSDEMQVLKDKYEFSKELSDDITVEEAKKLYNSAEDGSIKKKVYANLYSSLAYGYSVQDVKEQIKEEYDRAFKALENDILNPESAYNDYLKIAGEVEARNVQSRLGMTPEQRRNTLASETEDVAREDQIFLYDAMQADSRYITEDYKDVYVPEEYREYMDAPVKRNPAYDADTVFNYVYRMSPEYNRPMMEARKGILIPGTGEINIPAAQRLRDTAHDILGRKKQALLDAMVNSSMAARRYLMSIVNDIDDALKFFDELAEGKDVWRWKDPYYRNLGMRAENNPEIKKRGFAKHAREVASKFGVPVTVHHSLDSVPAGAAKNAIANGRKVKGWYDTKSQTIHIYMPNAASLEDVEATILHEGVAHYGLRQLVGEENFDDFLDEVFANVSDDVRKRILNNLAKYKYDARVATEEYMASLAEGGVDTSTWNRIKQAFKELLRKVGINVKITDNELKYILWRSAQNLRMSNPLDLAQDVAMQYQMGVGNYLREGTNFTDEEQAIINEAKKNGTYMKAPNGQPTNLTEKQWAQVRTQAFKDWFGDWENSPESASKVVDENGEPKVVYHGTLNEFSAFEPKRGMYGTIYFSKDINVASHFSGVANIYVNMDKAKSELKDAKDIDDLKDFAKTYLDARSLELYKLSDGSIGYKLFYKDGSSSSGSLYKAGQSDRDVFDKDEVFTEADAINSLKELFEGYTEWRMNNTKDRGRNLAVFLDIKNPLLVDANNAPYSRVNFRGNTMLTDDIAVIAKSEGYDGTVLGNVKETDLENILTTDYIVFSPTQIKSATENTGSFDPTDPDIRFRDTDTSISDYNETFNKAGYWGREAWQDNMLSLKNLQDIVEEQSGTPIQDFENAYMAENQLSRLNKAQSFKFWDEYMKPLADELGRMVKSKIPYQDIADYMMLSHGIERNIEMTNRERVEAEYNKTAKTDKAQAEKDREDAYNKFYSDIKALRKKYKGYDYLKALVDYFGEADDYSATEAILSRDGNAHTDFQTDALAKVKDFEDAHNVDNLRKLTKAATDAVIRKSFESGMMSRETYNRVKDMFAYYVPLRGWEGQTAEDVYDYMKDANPINSALKKMKGRKTIPDDVFATIGNMGESAIVQGNRNAMKQKFYNMAVNHPTDLITLTKAWYVPNVNGDMELSLPQIDATDDAETIAQKIKDHDELMRNTPGATQKKQGLNIDYPITASSKMQHAVIVKIGGKDYVMYVNGNPRAAQAVNGLTNPDAETNPALKATYWLNRQLSALYTSRNPEFLLPNFSRDYIEAGTVISVKEDADYRKAFRKNARSAIVDVAKGMRGKLKGQVGTYYKEFIENGGEMGYMTLSDVNTYKKKLKKQMGEITGRRGSAKKAFSYITDAVDAMNRYAETISRFATYRTSREMGRSIEQSIKDASDVTVNFSKKGSGFKSMTGKMVKDGKVSTFAPKFFGLTAGTIKMLKLFINPAVQSLANWGYLTKKAPKAVAGLVTAFAVGGFIMPMVNQILWYMFGDDDEECPYNDLPEWTRRNNLCIGFDYYLTIPLPHTLRAFYGIGELAYQLSSGRKKMTAGEITYDIINQLAALLPVNPLGNEGDIVKTLTPEAFMGAAEAYIWNEDFMGNPIAKITPFNERDPEYKRVYKGTAGWLVDATKFLNDWSAGKEAGRDFRKGTIDWNPAKIEHMGEAYFGGMWTFLNNTGKTIYYAGESLIEGELSDDLVLRNVPWVRRFVAKPDERSAFSSINEEYFDLVKEMEQFDYEVKGVKKSIPQDPERYSWQYEELMNGEDMKRYKIYEGYKGVLDYLYQISKQLEGDERDEVEMQIMGLRRELVEELRE